jgi:hypothetical protein
MREQAPFEAAPAQPMLTAGGTAWELRTGKVAIGGMCGVY